MDLAEPIVVSGHTEPFLLSLPALCGLCLGLDQWQLGQHLPLLQLHHASHSF